MAQQAPRTATPERWAKALERARGAGLVAYNLAQDPRHWFVTSSSIPGSGYTVSVVAGMAPTCLCAAGEHDPVCQHRALILDKLGLLPRVVSPAIVTPVEELGAIRECGRHARAELYGEVA